MYLEQRMKRDIALMPTTICCELQATPHTKDKNGVYNNCETTSFDSEIDLVTQNQTMLKRNRAAKNKLQKIQFFNYQLMKKLKKP